MRENQNNKSIFIIVLAFLSIYFCLFGLQKINLAAADIGRHVKNGELTVQAFLSNDTKTSKALLYTNFYSYTNPNFPFINHHWGSGVVAYLIFKVSGWDGLSVVYILLMLGALYFSLQTALEKSPLWIVFPIAVFLVPLMAERTEVRPEAVSYFFLMFFIFILFRYVHGLMKEKYLWLLPITMFFWANFHIYFIFGFFVIGVFGLELLLKKDWSKFKKLFVIGCVSAIAACVNPYGPYLLYYPFIIFKNYGYLVAENQSIAFLQNLHFMNPNFLWWYITAAIIAIACVGVFFKLMRAKKIQSDFPLALALIALTFAYLSFSAIRNFSLFGFVALPFLAAASAIIFASIKEKFKERWLPYAWAVVMSIAFIIFSIIHFSDRLPWHSNWGIGLLPNNNASADFVKQVGIKGPFFSDYDIGGYFIFNMYPEKVFTDNRPEAYPVGFFQNEYIPMQENDAMWNQEETKWNFNAIWFYRLDMTPWAQEFLIARVEDPEWVPVFVDDYTIVFVRNVPANSSIIQKYALPHSMFGIK